MAGLFDAEWLDPELKKALSQFAPADLTEADKKRALNQAIMQFGLGLMTARKGQEWDAVGRSGIGAIYGYNNNLLEQQKQRMAAQAAAMQGLNAYQQLRAVNDNIGASRALREYGQGGAAPQSPLPAQGMGDRGLGTVPAAPAGVASPAAPSAPSPTSRYEEAMRLADYMQSRGFLEHAAKIRADADKLRPKLKGTRVGLDKNGNRVTVQEFESGEEVPSSYAPEKKQLRHINIGGKTVFLDDEGNVPAGAGVYENTQSPDALLSAQTTRRGQDMTDKRMREQNQQGQWETDAKAGVQINKLTGEQRPITAGGQPVGSQAQQQRAATANDTLAVIKTAREIIPKATGSYYGAAQDQVARVLGHATPGAEAIAQLKALEGQLMLNQPRMEGPQSNLDVQLYRQMAAEIGDPTIPRSQKMKALKTIEDITKRYANKAAQQGGNVVNFSDLPK